MEKEKLIIKNFGPIKEVNLDLGRFTILIGEQATGKSTVAKVLAVCRYFSYIVEEDSSLHHDVFLDGLMAWGLSEYVKDNTNISYSCVHYTLKYERFTYIEERGNEWDDSIDEIKQQEFQLNLMPLSEDFKHLLDELEKIKPKQSDQEERSAVYNFWNIDWKIPTSFFLNDVRNIIDNPFYLPTQRGLQSIFDIGQNSVRNLSSALFNQLSKMDGIARLFKQETYIEPLDIYYVNRNGHGFIRKANETEFYSLYNSASGYQSMIPIFLVIKYYTDIKKRKKTLLIEEGEQNLFPSAQNKLMLYVVEKVMNSGSSILLTTQSPYMLTSLNNMMYAFQIGQINEQKVNEKLNKKYWVNPEAVSAYVMMSDGTAENIIDNDGLIKAEKIDEVSKIINKDFNDIMDIELGVDEAA